MVVEGAWVMVEYTQEGLFNRRTASYLGIRKAAVFGEAEVKNAQTACLYSPSPPKKAKAETSSTSPRLLPGTQPS